MSLWIAQNFVPLMFLGLFVILLSGIPVAGILVAIYFISRVPLTEEGMRETRRQLEARRGTV